MTNIQIFKKDNLIIGFIVSGHTGYAEAGKDILCSSISTLCLSTILGIKDVLKINGKLVRKDKQGYLEYSLQSCKMEEIEKSQVLLVTMQKSLQDIAWDNQAFIKLEVKNSDKVH